MTQEDKQLLLKDLGARLHYRVKVTTTNRAVELGVISGISTKGKISVRTKDADIVFECTEVKPYLRPMSSMTLEELEEYRRFGEHIRDAECKIHIANYNQIDWLNEHHFDYRNLIEKGLAIEVTEDNNPYKD